MPDDATDVVEAGLGQAGIVVARERRPAILPDRLMHVHARAVVAMDRFRHEGRSLASGVGDLMYGIFVELHLIGIADERVEPDPKLMLSRGDLMVVLLHCDTHAGKRLQHLRPQTLA